MNRINKIAADVAADRKPDDSYTPSMREAYARMAADLASARAINPQATLYIPADTEGLPGEEP